MKGIRLNDALVAVVKATSPEKWSRYCDLASKIAGTGPAEKGAAGRAMLRGERGLSAGDAFRLAVTDDPELRDMLHEAASLKKTFLDLFVEAVRSNKVSVSGFDPDDLRRPIRITAELINIALDGMHVEGSDANLDWDASTIQFGHRTLIGVRVTLNEARDRQQGGRPTVADWDAIEDLLRQEIKQRGPPNRENEKGWRNKADVNRWVDGVLEDREETAAPSTIRDRVNAMLKRVK